MNGPPPPLERYWFTRAEVAKMTGFTVSALAQLGANGEGPAFFKPGGKPSSTSRYFKDDVDDYMRNKPGPRGCQTLIVVVKSSSKLRMVYDGPTETPEEKAERILINKSLRAENPPVKRKAADPTAKFWKAATKQAMARRKITPELVAEAKANVEARAYYGEMSAGQTIDDFMADLRAARRKEMAE